MSSSKKTVSRRAQRRIQQVLEVKQLPNRSYRCRSRRKRQELEKKRLQPFIDYEKKRLIFSTSSHSTNNDCSDDNYNDNDETTDEPSSMDAYNEAHHHIENIIKDYSNEIRTINDSVKNRPTMSDIHSDNEFGLRKATGAIRYHNKSALIGKSRRRTNDGIDKGYQGKGQTLAYLVNDTIDDARPWRSSPYHYSHTRRRYYVLPNDPPHIFTMCYQHYIRPKRRNEKKEREEMIKNATSHMQHYIKQLENRHTFGKDMIRQLRGYESRRWCRVSLQGRHDIGARPHVSTYFISYSLFISSHLIHPILFTSSISWQCFICHGCLFGIALCLCALQ
jgi:hypothetical protein